jgi:hypothetical protein
MENKPIKAQSEIAKKITNSLRERINPSAAQSIVLLDLSSSMNNFTDGGFRRIDALQSALKSIPANTRFRLFGFNDGVYEESIDSVFSPAGGTRLAEALVVMREQRPSNLTIITDGEPDNAFAALSAAKELNCTINTIFVGDPHNYDAIRFCRALAAQHNGQFASNPLEAKTLALLPKTINLMLTDGKPREQGPIAL